MMARPSPFARTPALLAAMCILLAACGGILPARNASPQETLVFAADLSDQLSLDPAVAYEFGGILVEGQIYETLVSVEPGDPNIKPLLAKKWRIKDSGDAWTLTFTLDDTARFASGKPVTAADVVYSWARVIDLNKTPAFLLTDIAKLTKGGFKAVDPQVFLSIISFTVAAVVEQAIVSANAGSDLGSSWLNDHSAGSGPYALERWDRDTQNVIAANQNYWGKAPAIKRVIRAKELIGKAGVAEGTEIEMLVPAGGIAPGGVEWSTLAAKIQSDLLQIGLKINIKAIQLSELLNIYRAQKGQIVLIYWGPDYPDPDGTVTPFTDYSVKSIAWRNAWEAPEIANLGKQAAVERESARRAELYKQITERVLHEGPYIMLYQPVLTYGVRKNIKGFVYDSIDTPSISLCTSPVPAPTRRPPPWFAQPRFRPAHPRQAERPLLPLLWRGLHGG
jgi:ABC-type transport system substrate-binding protein